MDFYKSVIKLMNAINFKHSIMNKSNKTKSSAPNEETARIETTDIRSITEHIRSIQFKIYRVNEICQ